MTHYIVIEGVDGSGKTEVSAKIAQHIGAHLIESPMGEFQKIRKYVDENLSDKGRFFFYLASNVDLSNYVKKIRQEKSVVCARYFHSTLIGYASRNNISIDALYDEVLLDFKEFEKPDLTIFLHVNEEIQKSRIQGRDPKKNSLTDIKCVTDAAYQKNLMFNYDKICKAESWVRIDTSNMSLENVVETCLRRIECL